MIDRTLIRELVKSVIAEEVAAIRKTKAAPAPSMIPPETSASPFDITRRNRSDASAPSAIRNASSRVLCETA